jgi:hypothetical protein
MRQYNMVLSSERLGAESDCFGNCTSKLQTNPLVREGAQHQEIRNRWTENKNLAMESRWEPDTKIEWPTDRRS